MAEINDLTKAMAQDKGFQEYWKNNQYKKIPMSDKLDSTANALYQGLGMRGDQMASGLLRYGTDFLAGAVDMGKLGNAIGSKLTPNLYDSKAAGATLDKWSNTISDWDTWLRHRAKESATNYKNKYWADSPSMQKYYDYTNVIPQALGYALGGVADLGLGKVLSTSKASTKIPKLSNATTYVDDALDGAAVPTQLLDNVSTPKKVYTSEIDEIFDSLKAPKSAIDVNPKGSVWSNGQRTGEVLSHKGLKVEDPMEYFTRDWDALDDVYYKYNMTNALDPRFVPTDFADDVYTMTNKYGKDWWSPEFLDKLVKKDPQLAREFIRDDYTIRSNWNIPRDMDITSIFNNYKGEYANLGNKVSLTPVYKANPNSVWMNGSAPKSSWMNGSQGVYNTVDNAVPKTRIEQLVDAVASGNDDAVKELQAITQRNNLLDSAPVTNSGSQWLNGNTNIADDMGAYFDDMGAYFDDILDNPELTQKSIEKYLADSAQKTKPSSAIKPGSTKAINNTRLSEIEDAMELPRGYYKGDLALAEQEFKEFNDTLPFPYANSKSAANAVKTDSYNDAKTFFREYTHENPESLLNSLRELDTNQKLKQLEKLHNTAWLDDATYVTLKNNMTPTKQTTVMTKPGVNKLKQALETINNTYTADELADAATVPGAQKKFIEDLLAQFSTTKSQAIKSSDIKKLKNWGFIKQDDINLVPINKK